MSRYVVIVAGERLVIRLHAAEQYVERVRPALSLEDANAELQRVLVHGELLDRCPSWMAPQAVDGTIATRWLVLGSDLCFPIAGDRLVTCIVRGMEDGTRRQEKRAGRQQRSEYRRRKRQEGTGNFSGRRKLAEAERRAAKRRAA